jgi:hypothetical protein
MGSRAILSRARLGYMAATMLVLSLALGIATWRYPDRARLLCDDQAPGDVPACVESYYHNFAARGRLISAALVVSVVLVGLAFRRRLDVRRDG